jgi:AmmeMemoRadiSam system protein A
VASTDLSHFHSDVEARSLDAEFIENLERYDPDGLVRDLGAGRTEACGGGPTAAAMIASRSLGAKSCTVLKYANSGDVSGDRGSVVGYVSAAITRAAQETGGSGSTGDEVGEETRIFLLRYARATINEKLGIASPDIEKPDDPLLGEHRGGFVTLKKNGRLRGCIGYIEAVKPLLETVREMALSAAFNDYRFEPVTKDEAADLAIEISVLSPVREADASEIEVGRHGIIISGSGRRGLLLPQVAVEYGWDRETFLDQTCVKAGLPPGSWRSGDTVIEIFSAEIFSEEEMGLR